MPDQPSSLARRYPYVGLMLFMIATYGVGFIGAFATNSALGFWYITLAKPTWTPPGWLFAPVWTILYGLMAWAAWLVWQMPSSKVRTTALSLFFGQLVLNGLWSWLFFGWHKLLSAFVELVVLWISILVTGLFFNRLRPTAGALMLPYLLWVTFAGALNFAIYRMNR